MLKRMCQTPRSTSPTSGMVGSAPQARGPMSSVLDCTVAYDFCGSWIHIESRTYCGSKLVQHLSPSFALVRLSCAFQLSLLIDWVHRAGVLTSEAVGLGAQRIVSCQNVVFAHVGFDAFEFPLLCSVGQHLLTSSWTSAVAGSVNGSDSVNSDALLSLLCCSTQRQFCVGAQAVWDAATALDPCISSIFVSLVVMFRLHVSLFVVCHVLPSDAVVVFVVLSRTCSCIDL